MITYKLYQVDVDDTVIGTRKLVASGKLMELLGGCECIFVPISKRRGIKLYGPGKNSVKRAEYARALQITHYRKGVAPPVHSELRHYELKRDGYNPVIYVGFITYRVNTFASDRELVKWLEKEGESQREQLDKIESDRRLYGDYFYGNVGIYKGKLVIIDFGYDSMHIGC